MDKVLFGGRVGGGVALLLMFWQMLSAGRASPDRMLEAPAINGSKCQMP